MEKSKILVVVLAALVLIACCVSAGCVSEQPSQSVTSPTLKETPVPTQVQTAPISAKSVVGEAWAMVVNGIKSGDYLVFNSDGTFEEIFDLRDSLGKIEKYTFHWIESPEKDGTYLQVIGKTPVGMYVLQKYGTEMISYNPDTNSSYTFVRIPLSDVPK